TARQPRCTRHSGRAPAGLSVTAIDRTARLGRFHQVAWRGAGLPVAESLSGWTREVPGHPTLVRTRTGPEDLLRTTRHGRALRYRHGVHEESSGRILSKTATGRRPIAGSLCRRSRSATAPKAKRLEQCDRALPDRGSPAPTGSSQTWNGEETAGVGSSIR